MELTDFIHFFSSPFTLTLICRHPNLHRWVKVAKSGVFWFLSGA